MTVTRLGFQPFIGSARIAGPVWVSGSVTRIIHQQGSPHRSLVRLHLDTAVDGDMDRSWYAQDQLPDYGIIMDAVTDAYVQDKTISLFVNLIDQGGTIERFAFGYPLWLVPHPADVADIRAVELPAVAAPITVAAPSPPSMTPVEDTAAEEAVAGITDGRGSGAVDLQATADQDGQKMEP